MVHKAFNPALCRAELRYGPNAGTPAAIRALALQVYDTLPGTTSEDLMRAQVMAGSK